jgi:transposase
MERAPVDYRRPMVDLDFTEFTRHVKDLGSELTCTLLENYPIAEAFRAARLRTVACLRYDGRHFVGRRAGAGAAGDRPGECGRPPRRSLARPGAPRVRGLGRAAPAPEGPGAQKLEAHDVGNPADFRDAKALAAYAGVVPELAHSGKRSPSRAGLCPYGNAWLRHALWMPTLTAVLKNPWLRRFYEGLRARGKLPKQALVAAMRKLLAAVYSVAKRRQPFTPLLPATPSSTPSPCASA